MARSGVHWFLAVIGICLFSELVQCSFYNVGVKYKVNLNVFSGRENPEWEIDESSPLYDRVSWLVNDGPPTEMDDDLGYQGFVVEASNMMGQTAWKTVGAHTNRQLESILLRSCPSTAGLSRRVMNHVQSGIIGQYRRKVLPQSPMAKIVKTPITRVSIKTSNEDDNHQITIRHKLYGRKKRQAAGVCSVSFQPQNWNSNPIRRRNNCYNYATNIQTNTFAQPGRGSGRRYSRNEANEVYQATLRDGLTPLRGPDAGYQCLIALIIWQDEDYHFLRLDNSGYWSQKSGRTEARNTDDSMELITDPRTSDNGPYTIFAGWLGVGPNVNIN